MPNVFPTLSHYTSIRSSILHGLIPCPDSIELADGKLPIESLKSVSAPTELKQYADELVKAFRFFGKELETMETGQVDIKLAINDTLPRESWQIEITPKAIAISGGSKAGMLYAISAMKQLLTLAMARGPKNASLDAGSITDQPRNEWRGLMLDSVRHFQSKEKIKEVIRLISEYRLNVFHWHLSDIQGYRLPSSIVKPSEDGFYSLNDLKEIIAFAADRNVQIVPELDMPGHAMYILQQFPQYACDPENVGFDFCLANPDGKELLKSLLVEVMALFPDSPIIHIGGDEAGPQHWEKCPKCQAALKEAGLNKMRELEGKYMNEMTSFVVSKGRTPMVWYTETVYPTDTLVQAWTSILDIIHTHPHGNHMVNSSHYSCYLDYPADSTDPHGSWMPSLSKEAVYQACEPLDAHSNLVNGVEACLWTEIVPEWRVIPKLMSRLQAFAEHAWTRPENKDWHDFQRRKKQLQAVGYEELIRMCD